MNKGNTSFQNPLEEETVRDPILFKSMDRSRFPNRVIHAVTVQLCIKGRKGRGDFSMAFFIKKIKGGEKDD
jgi:hypothetical protein